MADSLEEAKEEAELKNLETTNTDFDLENLPPAVKLLVLDKMNLKVDDIVADVTENVGPPPDIFDFDSNADWKSGVSLLTSEEIQTIQDQGFVVRDSVLGQFSLESIHTELAKMKEDEELKPSKMNNGWVNSDIRGDLIRMVSSDEVDKLPIFTQALIFQLDAIRQDLNEHLNFGSEKVQIQITCYPGGGSEYKPHIDGNDSVKRRLTCLYYANTQWQAGDGGELQLFLPNGKKKKIRPSCDTLVIFQSQWLPHCVLPTNFERFAVTFWMY